MNIFNEIYDEAEINVLISKSTPRKSNFKVISFERKCGWAYIKAQANNQEFSINYSSYMTDERGLIKFLKETFEQNNEVSIFLDYEGSDPLIYLCPKENNEIRFLFAHDYELFLDDNIDDYSIREYKIECDVVLDKKMLSKEFLKMKTNLDFGKD